MINIWSYTTFSTDNFTDKFLDIKNKYDLDSFVKNKDNFFVFWWGSNLLFSKSRYEEFFFVRNILWSIEYLWWDIFKVSAWENLNKFIIYIENEYWSNILNPLFWLPGTIGGAVIGNAWSFGIEIWNFVEKISYFDKDKNYIETDDYRFDYRNSSLKWKNILLVDIYLNIPKTIDSEIKNRSYYFDRRKQKQEYSKTCWSYFKNYEIDNYIINNNDLIDKINNLWFNSSNSNKIPAWWLIEQCWMKWFEYNWVKVSSKHANFIINHHNKDPKNILDLSYIIKDKVYEKFQIKLQEEVIIF